MSVSGYSKPRVLLHWLSAVVIVWTLVSGFYVASFQVSSETKRLVGFFNVSLTTVFIPIFILRLCLVILHIQPARMRSLSGLQWLAVTGHLSIYLMVSVVLVTGVLMMDHPISVFALFEITHPLRDPALIGQYFALHIVSCMVLLFLVIAHIGAVVVHELSGHRVLRRMLPRRSGSVVSVRQQ